MVWLTTWPGESHLPVYALHCRGANPVVLLHLCKYHLLQGGEGCQPFLQPCGSAHRCPQLSSTPSPGSGGLVVVMLAATAIPEGNIPGMLQLDHAVLVLQGLPLSRSPPHCHHTSISFPAWEQFSAQGPQPCPQPSPHLPASVDVYLLLC